MKWFNKTKTKCLDISSISFWEYTSSEDIAKDAQTKHPAFRNVIDSVSYIQVVSSGCKLEFYGKEAEEIYNILKKQKELLKG